MSDQDDPVQDAAIARGMESFRATHGQMPEGFALLLRHAPAAFGGYGLIRASLMRGPEEGGALDLRTKEFIFTLLDVLAGALPGAKAHAANAIRLGLTLPELAEGLVQCLLVGGITCWNLTGQHVLRHAEEIAATLPQERGTT
jgi:alkylhydroperoxidase/carboxymuconolactone decarboxylase family protein YurZ